MTDDPNKADRNTADEIIGEGWMEPGYRRFHEALDRHPQRELINKRSREVDENGRALWRFVRDVEDGIVWYSQHPSDPTDDRGTVIGAWPEDLELDDLADVQAIIEEHDTSAWPPS